MSDTDDEQTPTTPPTPRLSVALDPMNPWETIECDSNEAADHWDPRIWR